MTREQREGLQELLKQTKSKSDYQRVQCLWLRASLGLSSAEVAAAIGWSQSRVKQVQSRYFREGESSLVGVGRGGRRQENLSVEAERRWWERFLARARAGGVLVVSEIQAAYEEAVGHRVAKSTVYRLLARHGWRKIAPRPRHPKSDPAKQAAFKKTP
jgi:transposase